MNCEPTDPKSGPHPRLFYRDEDQFRETLDKAVAAIEKQKRSDLLAQIAWWSLITGCLGLFLGDRIFGWSARYVIPGVDLVKVLGGIIVALVLYYHAWVRQSRRRILKYRMCLACGEHLRRQPVDDDGDGECPSCNRGFNLGEYRRPAENIGTAFRPYLDREHFNTSIYAVSEHLKKASPLGLEGLLLGYYSVGVIAMWIAGLFGWAPMKSIPGPQPSLLIATVIMFMWGWWYRGRVTRFGPNIIDNQLCFNCGYCLQQTPTKDDVGRCPECATPFHIGQYEAPPKPTGD